MVFYPAIIGWTLLGVWITSLKSGLIYKREKFIEWLKNIFYCWVFIYGVTGSIAGQVTDPEKQYTAFDMRTRQNLRSGKCDSDNFHRAYFVSNQFRQKK